MGNPVSVAVKQAHDAAVAEGLLLYRDPITGYQVFTSTSHVQRGYCCGNKCRHCPYDDLGDTA